MLHSLKYVSGDIDPSLNRPNKRLKFMSVEEIMQLFKDTKMNDTYLLNWIKDKTQKYLKGSGHIISLKYKQYK